MQAIKSPNAGKKKENTSKRGGKVRGSAGQNGKEMEKNDF